MNWEEEKPTNNHSSIDIDQVSKKRLGDKKKKKEKNIEINPNILQVFEEQGCVIPACVMFRPDSNHDIYLQYKREYIYIYEYN